MDLVYTIVVFGVIFIEQISTYYDSILCFGTGDCIIGLTAGGHADDNHRWNTECHDGEGMIGIRDSSSDYQGFGDVWCRFMFPKKPPSFGIYPYYDYCNVRDISLKELYCYDKYYPSDTYDTFIVAMSSSQYYPGGISVSNSYKCCVLPEGYHFDYRRCEYKYTHDMWGEHYDGNYWLVRCDENFIMTGIGQAANPWTNALHYTWIQFHIRQVTGHVLSVRDKDETRPTGPFYKKSFMTFNAMCDFCSNGFAMGFISYMTSHITALVSPGWSDRVADLTNVACWELEGYR